MTHASNLEARKQFRRKATVYGAAGLLSTFAALGGWSSASAHHSFAMFEGAKVLTLNGTVREFQWVNPHAWIQLAVMGADGSTTEWAIELGAPGGLLRTGWKPRTLKPGDKISVSVHPLKDGRPGGSFVSAKDAGGAPIGGAAKAGG